MSSSGQLAKLKVDFYESGIGETIVITFPSGGLAIVDAHPSGQAIRPDIQQITQGKKLHFVCLTHPHADHGVDLVTVLERHPEVGGFWHTIFDIPAFIYGVEQTVNFPSPVREYASKMNQDWGEFLFDILSAVIEHEIPRHCLRSDLMPMEIDGVQIHCLSPDEIVQNQFFSAYTKKLSDPRIEVPDPNLLSAILAFKLGQGVILLGSDGLKKNWETAVTHYQKRSLPKARVFKVPHHGARNSLNMQRRAVSYLDICSHEPRAKAVIFAGDAKHPDPDVFEKLRSRADTICLSNGRKSVLWNTNPLALQIPTARVAYAAPICNASVSFEMDSDGNVELITGLGCNERCAVANP